MKAANAVSLLSSKKSTLIFLITILILLILIYKKDGAKADENSVASVEFVGIEERILFVQKVPEPPYKAARSGEDLLLVNQKRNQVYLGKIGAPDFRRVGSFGRAEGEYQNVTDAGFSPFDNQVYVLDQANQRLLFYSDSGKFKRSLPFGLTLFAHFRSTIFGALATRREILLVGTANEQKPPQIHRISWDGRYVSSFFKLPDRFHKMNLSGFGVPFVRAYRGKIFVALKVDPAIRMFENGDDDFIEINGPPAFYRPPIAKPKDLKHGSEEFWHWFQAWNSLVDLIPFEDGFVQVFYLHHFPRFGIAFLSHEGTPIRNPIRTDLQAFDIYEDDLLLFSDTGIYRADMSEGVP